MSTMGGSSLDVHKSSVWRGSLGHGKSRRDGFHSKIIAGKCQVQKQSFVCVQMPNTTLKTSHLCLWFLMTSLPWPRRRHLPEHYQAMEVSCLKHWCTMLPSLRLLQHSLWKDSLHQQLVLISGKALHRVSPSPSSLCDEAVLHSDGDLPLLRYMSSALDGLACLPSCPWTVLLLLLAKEMLFPIKPSVMLFACYFSSFISFHIKFLIHHNP